MAYKRIPKFIGFIKYNLGLKRDRLQEFVKKGKKYQRRQKIKRKLKFK